MTDAPADHAIEPPPARASGDSSVATASAASATSVADLTANGQHSLPVALSPADAEAAADPLVGSPSIWRRIHARWRGLDRPQRRLLIWACFVLSAACLLRVGSAAQPAWAPPEDRFQQFCETVQQRLPALLYGEAGGGLSPPPVVVEWEIKPVVQPGKPLTATLKFEEATLTRAGRILYTRYVIDYRWRGDHWQCENLRCDVERPELSKLEQMNFEAVVAHESLEQSMEFVKLKRAQAESLLRPNQPLGSLLRSVNVY